MSRALDFLMQARPQAMGAYFTFLRTTAAGSSQDPRPDFGDRQGRRRNRTRPGAVHAQALQAGASADEILDALMMAFPRWA